MPQYLSTMGINRNIGTTAFWKCLNKVYVPVETLSCFGFIKRTHTSDNLAQLCEKVLEEGHKKSFREGWRFNFDERLYIKKLGTDELGTDELKTLPPHRFINSVTMYDRQLKNSGISSILAEPIGLIYSGSGIDLLTGQSKAYYISKYVCGERLIDIIKKLTSSQKKNIFSKMHWALLGLLNVDIGLLDFAPRDIIIRDAEYPAGTVNEIQQQSFQPPVFADTEHVEYVIDKRASAIQSYRLKQLEQFSEDYAHFLKPEELKEAENIIFPEFKK